MDATCSHVNIRGTDLFKKIAYMCKEDNMAVYEKLLVVVVAVNCLVIDLKQRDLIEIPSSIDSGVTTLNLELNKIKGIDATALMAFRELIMLNLAYNEIYYIGEEAFDNNPKLRDLHLQGNRIDSMTSSFGAAHSSLELINLWGALTQEGTRTSNVSRCVNLQRLIIGYNGYPTLDVSILPYNLLAINIKSANLKEFPDFAHGTPYLKKLDIQNNLISSIPAERIEGLKNLVALNIAGNPLKCDCHLRDFRMLYAMGVLNEWDEPVCETPPALHGQMFLAMDNSTLKCPTGKRIPGTNFTNMKGHLIPAWMSNPCIVKKWIKLLILS